MSHFTVAVFSHKPDDFESLLAPYEEELVNDDGEYILNPNGKWDWYQVGGRWFGLLKLKPGCDGGRGHPSLILGNVDYEENKCDQAIVRDVDFSMNQKAYDKAIRFWEVVVEGLPIRDDEHKIDFMSFYTPKYYLEQFGTKEEYAKDEATFRTWAFITPDGRWFENGEMLMFGIDNATNESRKTYCAAFDEMLANGQDLWITIVDCHI